jgi:hypothetical protein
VCETGVSHLEQLIGNAADVMYHPVKKRSITHMIYCAKLTAEANSSLQRSRLTAEANAFWPTKLTDKANRVVANAPFVPEGYPPPPPLPIEGRDMQNLT